MGRRRWTTDQYMRRYVRRMERREFNKAYDNITHPPSPDGTRLCKNCVKNESCELNRRRNHGSCFVAGDSEAQYKSEYEKRCEEIERNANAKQSSNASVAIVTIIFLVLGGGVIYLCSVNSAILCFVLLAIILLAVCAGK